MYKFLIVALLSIGMPYLNIKAEETTLFDSDGNAAAYIYSEDQTIYTWSGKPVAYIVSDNGKSSIYGFNGKHLGWFIKSVIRDHEGDAVGFIKGAMSAYTTSYEPIKSYKQNKPFKSFKENAPFVPFLSNSFSITSLPSFLAQGAD